MKAYLLASLLFTASVMPSSLLLAANDQPVVLRDAVEIPGGSLTPGSYTFGVEDRLPDRAVVRISSSQGIKGQYLLLTVPNPQLSAENGLQYFNLRGENRQALRAWKCSSCSAPLEFVYPKPEAVKITDASAQPVLAADPAPEKLPNNLSADDARVVTLWASTPERVTPANVEYRVTATDYPKPHSSATRPTKSHAAAVASAAPHRPATLSAAQASALQVASAGRQRLPETASNTPLVILCGCVCLIGAFAVRLSRLRRA
jgi:hypothetical protein